MNVKSSKKLIPLVQSPKKLSSFFLAVLVLLASALFQFALAQPSCNLNASDSAGTKADDDGDGLIEICTLDGLDAIRYSLSGQSYKASMNASGITQGCPGGTCKGYELIRDLDFQDDDSYRAGRANTQWTTTRSGGWLPIGYSNNSPFTPFTGFFEGNGYTIKNLLIDRIDSTFYKGVGLFGVIDAGSKIANVRLSGINIKGKRRVGALVGHASDGSTITHSYTVGTNSVQGIPNDPANSFYIGGLVGVNYGTIIYSRTTGTVSASYYAGGLVGANLSPARITNSSASGVVQRIGYLGWGVKGGLAGFNSGIVKDSYADVSVSGLRRIGGLVGYNASLPLNHRHRSPHRRSSAPVISNSSAAGRVSGRDDVGGLVGRNDQAIVRNSQAFGVVTANRRDGRKEIHVGGLVGYNVNATIENSYALGAVTGNQSRVGGLVGYNLGNSRIANSYATGKVTGNNEVGGLVGHNAGGTIKSCYASGDVYGLSEEGYLAGLVAYNSPHIVDGRTLSEGEITHCYARGQVQLLEGSVSSRLAGLVANNQGSVASSYWHRGSSRLLGVSTGSSVGIKGVTEEELKLPTTPTAAIYSGWSTDDWDFGTAIQYAALKYVVGPDSANPACSNDGTPASLPQCGALLPNQRVLQDLVLTDSASQMIDLSEPFSESEVYTARIFNLASLTLTVRTHTTSQFIQVSRAGTQIGTVLASASGEFEITSLAIGLTPIDIRVGSTAGGVKHYRLNIFRYSTKVRVRSDETLSTLTVEVVSTPTAVPKQTYQWSKWNITGRTFVPIGGAVHSTYGLAMERSARAAGTLYRVVVTLQDSSDNEIDTVVTDYRIPNVAPRLVGTIEQVDVDEGSSVTLDLSGKYSDLNYDTLHYIWLATPATDSATFTLDIPPDFVESGASKAVQVPFLVSDGSAVTAGEIAVLVRKIDNGKLKFRINIEGSTLTAVITEEDPDGAGRKRWQWKKCSGTSCPVESNAGWSSVISRKKNYIIPNPAQEGERFRVVVRYTDNQGYAYTRSSSVIHILTYRPTTSNSAPQIIPASFAEQIVNLHGAPREIDVTVLNYDVGDTLSVAATAIPADIVTVSPTRAQGAKSHTFVLSAVRAGTATVTITATDRHSSATSVTVPVRVNISPQVAERITTQTVTVGRTLQITPALSSVFEDADSKLLSYHLSAPTLSSLLTVRQTNKGEVYGFIDVLQTPSSIDSAGYPMTITVQDEHGATASVSFRVVLNEAVPTIDSMMQQIAGGLPARITANQLTVTEGQLVSITAAAGDPDGGLLSYAWRVLEGASHLLDNVVTDQATLTLPIAADWVDAEASQSSETVLLLTVTDDEGAEATTEVRVIVNKVNNGSLSLVVGIEGNTTLTSAITADDPEGLSPISYYRYRWESCTGTCSQTNDQGWTTASGVADQSMYIRADSTPVGTQFRLKLGYTDGQSYAETVRSELISSVAPNRRPVIIIESFSGRGGFVQLDSNTPLTVRVLDSDVGDTVSVAATASPAGVVTVLPASAEGAKSHTFILKAVRAGRTTVTFTATDSHSSATTVVLPIIVNTPPHITARAAQVTTTKTFVFSGPGLSIPSIAGLFTDDDGDSLSYTLGGLPEGFSYRIENGALVITTSTTLPTLIPFIPKATTEGRPLTIDGRYKPYLVQIVAYDGKGGIAKVVFPLVLDDASLNYRWSVLKGANRALADAEITQAILIFTPPTDLLASDEAQTTLTLLLTVTTGDAMTTAAATVFVSKGNDGPINSMALGEITRLERANVLRLTKVTAQTLAQDPDGARTTTNISYQWQRCRPDETVDCAPDSAGWGSAPGTMSTAIYVVATDSRPGDTFRVRVSYTDGQDYSNAVTSDPYIMSNPPTIEAVTPISFDAELIVEPGATDITVRIRDEDLNDQVTVEAQSSTQGIVSVVLQTSDTVAETYTYRLTAKKIGTATVTMTATDTEGLIERVTLMVRVDARAIPTVDPANEPPTIEMPNNNTQISVKEGRTTLISVIVTDGNTDDELTLSLSAEHQGFVAFPAEQTVTTNGEATRSATLMLRGLKVGATTLSLVAKDDSGLTAADTSAPITLRVTVIANSTPTISGLPTEEYRLQLDAGARQIAVTLGDDDDDDTAASLSISVVSSKEAVVLATLDDAMSFTRQLRLSPQSAGTATISVTVSDNKRVKRNSTVTQHFTVRVNTQPTLAMAITTQTVTQGVDPNRQIIQTNTFTDADRDALTYTAIGLPTGLMLSTEGKLTGITNVAATTNVAVVHIVTVTAADGNEGTTKTTFRLLINAAATGTVTIDDSRVPNELTATTRTVSDANGFVADQTSYQWFRQVVGGSFEAAPGATSRSHTYTLPTGTAGRAAGTKYRVRVNFIDHIGQGTTLTSADYEIENKAPVIVALAPFSTTEGLSVTINVAGEVSDPNADALSYAWHVAVGDKPSSLLAGQRTDATTLTFTVPKDWVTGGAEVNQTTVSLQLTVSDATTQTLATLPLVIVKVNNGPIRLALSGGLLGVPLKASITTADPDGDGTTPTFQWQSCPHDAADNCVADSSNWMPIPSAPNTQTYTVPASSMTGDKFRVLVAYTDGQAYATTETSNLREYNTLNDRPAIVSVVPDSDMPISVQAGRTTSILVVVADGNTFDELTLSLSAQDPSQDFVELPTPQIVAANRMTTRSATPLMLKGLKVGTTTLSLVVKDNSDSSVDDTSAPTTLRVMVTANTAPTIDGLPTTEHTLQLDAGAQQITVVLRDDDDDDIATRLSVRVMSSKETVVLATLDDAISSTRQLTVTPRSAGTATISVTVSDNRGVAGSSTAMKHFIVRVNARPLLAMAITDQTVTRGTTVNQQIIQANTFTDANADDTLSYSATGLPEGLSLSDSGRLTGRTTATAATYTVTVTADDNHGGTAQTEFKLQLIAGKAIRVRLKLFLEGALE